MTSYSKQRYAFTRQALERLPHIYPDDGSCRIEPVYVETYPKPSFRWLTLGRASLVFPMAVLLMLPSPRSAYAALSQVSTTQSNTFVFEGMQSHYILSFDANIPSEQSVSESEALPALVLLSDFDSNTTETEADTDTTKPDTSRLAESPEVINLPSCIEKQSYEQSLVIEIPKQTPCLEGYKFLGWSTKPYGVVEYLYTQDTSNSTEKSFSEEQDLPLSTICLSSKNPEVVLYALWEQGQETFDLPINTLFPETSADTHPTKEDQAVLSDEDDDEATLPDVSYLPQGSKLNAYLKGIEFSDAQTQNPSVVCEDISVKRIVFGSFAQYEEIVKDAQGIFIEQDQTYASDNNKIAIYRLEKQEDLSEEQQQEGQEPQTFSEVYVLSQTGCFKADTDFSRAFSCMSALESIEGMSLIDTSSTTMMLSSFWGCRSLTSLDLSGFDTSSVKAMDSLFWGCESLVSLDLTSFDTSLVKEAQAMFSGCTSLVEVILGEKWSLGPVLISTPQTQDASLSSQEDQEEEVIEESLSQTPQEPQTKESSSFPELPAEMLLAAAATSKALSQRKRRSLDLPLIFVDKKDN